LGGVGLVSLLLKLLVEQALGDHKNEDTLSGAFREPADIDR